MGRPKGSRNRTRREKRVPLTLVLSTAERATLLAMSLRARAEQGDATKARGHSLQDMVRFLILQHRARMVLDAHNAPSKG